MVVNLPPSQNIGSLVKYNLNSISVCPLAVVETGSTVLPLDFFSFFFNLKSALPLSLFKMICFLTPFFFFYIYVV